MPRSLLFLFSRLRVANGGRIPTAEQIAHLFEPFFSSQSRSSGLGLYICRELCQRYDASISYQRLARNTPQGDVNGNAFIVTLRSGPSSLASHSLFDSIMV